MNKTFVTIVTHAENLELKKDPGQVPYHMHKMFGYDSTLVTYFYTLTGGRNAGPLTVPPADEEAIAKNYPYLDEEVPGLKLHFLSNTGRHRFYEKAVSDYLKTNAKSIDILHLFHFSSENIYYILLYKRKNPKGKVYLKLDIDISYYRAREYFFNVNLKLAFLKIFIIQKIFYPFFFTKADIISAESVIGLDYFKKRFNVPSEKMLLLPNGVDETRLNMITGGARRYDEKENILISVGRIGTGQKNNIMLLNALSDIDLKDWKVYFVGPIEPAFKAVISEFYEKQPMLREKIFFTGKIANTKELYEFYNRAKVFCLTSLNEGFPLSASEAAFFGNYLVLTDTIYCFNELTDNGRYGMAVPLNDTVRLTKTINHIINNDWDLLKNCDGMRKYAADNLTWQAIVPRLHRKLIA